MSNILITQMSEAEFRFMMKQVFIEVVQGSSLIRSPEESCAILTMNQAVAFLGISKATLYYYTSKNLIPFSKQGKRCYFSKPDLLAWLQAGRIKTVSERLSDANQYLTSNKK